VWELTADEVHIFLSEIKGQIYLLQHGTSNLRERNEASMDRSGGTW
jgi:hypothetical protein